MMYSLMSVLKRPRMETSVIYLSHVTGIQVSSANIQTHG